MDDQFELLVDLHLDGFAEAAGRGAVVGVERVPPKPKAATRKAGSIRSLV